MSSVIALAVREVLHRKLHFAMGAAGACAATSLVCGGLSLLTRLESQTQSVVAERRARVAQLNAELNESMIRITKGLGFNIVIVPRGQNLDDPFADSYAALTMPESHADRLAKAAVVTVNHLLPTLERRTVWPERRDRALFLLGIKGQMPQTGREAKAPIQEPVPPGGIVLGAALAKDENLAVGHEVVLRGERLHVTRIHPRKGDKRDLSAWINLELMQRLFALPGRISAIWALECSCALADVGKVREELGKLLPDVEIEEEGEKALARAEARKKAAETAEASLAAEKASGERLASLSDRFASVLVPLLVAAGGLWIGLLAMANVRERREEIGLLGAVGFGGRRIAALVLLRSVASGVVGSFAGVGIGVALAASGLAALARSDGTLPGAPISGGAASLDVPLIAWTLGLAPVVAALSGWIPALTAARDDPAAILRGGE